MTLTKTIKPTRVLTIKQPWAELIAQGRKDVELRTRPLGAMNGALVAIHMARTDAGEAVLAGHIVAVAALTACRDSRTCDRCFAAVVQVKNTKPDWHLPTTWVGWHLDGIRRVQPLLWPGQQGFANYTGPDLVLAEEEPVTPPALTAIHALTLHNLQQVALARGNRWHGGSINQWSPADWAMAMMGEAGEACNALKKLRRAEEGIANVNEPGRQITERKQAIAHVGEELADTLLYLLALASRLDIDIAAAVVAKFNSVSVKYGFPERLPTGEPTP